MTVLVRVSHPHVEVTDFGAVVRGTRVPVRRLWSWHRRGLTCDVLWKRYPTIPPGHVLDALSFAYDNVELIEAELASEQARANGCALVPGEMSQLPLPKKRP